jgi:hypothetical protein
MEKAKLSCWKAYNKNKTEQNLRALKAEIYELYCHEQIFINSEENTIVFPTCKEMEKKEQLRLSKIGKILFYSDEVSLAEFDVLGMNSSSVLWYEVTTAEKLAPRVKAGLKRKKFFLEHIFPDKKVLLTLLVPEERDFGIDVNQLVIKEPKYSKYLTDQFISLQIDIKRCLEFEKLKDVAGNYNYIEHVKNESIKFFSGDDSDLKRLKKECVIERLYDSDNMHKCNFKYYDVSENRYGEIKTKNSKYYKDGKRVSQRKKTYDEIKKLRQVPFFV